MSQQNRQVFALIRHGDYHQQAGAPSAWQPHGLTETGFSQARQAAATLAAFAQQQGLGIAQPIHSSSLRRAWETAETIARALYPDSNPSECIQSTDQLTERSVGSLANLTADQIESLLAQDPRFSTPPTDWKSNSHFRLPVPGAESLMDSGRRVANYMASINPDDNDQLWVIVGHGASIRHGAHCLGILEFDDIAKLSMYHAEPVFVARDDAGNWSHIGGAWKVRKTQSAYTD